ncbi:MAG: universal stress protein [Rhodothermales bacterium]
MLNLKNILIAHDLDHSSDQALRYATDLAETTGATLHVVYGALEDGDPDNVPPEAELPDSVFLEQIKNGSSPLPSGSRVASTIDVEYAVARGLNPAGALVQYADEHAIDLIVTGSHERSTVGRFLRGSVSEKVARAASCPVSIVKPHARA